MYFAIAIVIIFLSFFFIFRKQIIGLFPRVKSIGKSGVVLDSEQQGTSAELDPRAEAEAMMRQFDSALLREVEEIIKKELDQKKLLGNEGIPVLIRYLAALSILLIFSETYRIIWGSQLNLLDYLNTQDGQPVSNLRTFYTLGMSQYPGLYKNYSFEQWLGYLKDQLLIREDRGIINITVRGREFLAYLIRAGLSRNKPG